MEDLKVYSTNGKLISTKKQSSIEWLENEIDFILTTYSYNSQDFHLNKAFEKAKQMHKNEIVDAYVYGAAYQIDIKNGLSPIVYYNEKLGGDNE